MTELIRAYLAHCRAGGLARTTVEKKEKMLLQIDRELPMGLEHAYEHELVNIIGKVKANGEPHYRVASRRALTVHVQQFCRYAADPRRDIGISYDPSAGLTMPRVPKGRPRPIKDGEREKVLTLAAEPYRTWAEVALLTGMRCCEIAGVDLDQGDIDEHRVFVRCGKGGKTRDIPTDPDLWAIVKGLPGGMLARTHTGQPADAAYVSIRSAMHFRRGLKLPGVSLHRMRDTFATDLLDAGVDIRIIQEILGHASLASTQKYTLVRKVHCENAIHAVHLHRHAPR